MKKKSLGLGFVLLIMCLFASIAYADTVPYEYTGLINTPDGIAASIVETTSGTLLLVGQDYQFASQVIAMNSTDGGKTWTNRRNLNIPLINNASWHMANLLKLPSGRILLILSRRVVSNGGIPAICYSDDNGSTWSTPVLLTNDPEEANYVTSDRTIRTSTGRIIVPYEVCHSGEGNNSTSGCFYSDDSGSTWSRCDNEVSITDPSGRGIQEPSVVELDNGDIMMVARTGTGYLYKSISTDGGEIWGTAVSTGLTSPCSSCNMKKTSSGTILLCWNNVSPESSGSLGPRTPLTCAISTDNGSTWGNIINIDESQDMTYPSINFLNDKVLFTYYWKGVNTYPVKMRAVSNNIVLNTGSYFYIKSPSNKITQVGTSPTLTWSALSGATTYRLTVADNSSFSNPVFDSDVGNVTSRSISGLSNSTRYYWKVVATKNGNAVAAVNNNFYFDTVANPSTVPGSFSLSSPSNNATGQDIYPILSWSASTGVSSYNVIVSTNSSFTNATTYNTIDNTYQLTEISVNTTYYWKVVAKNAIGNTNASNNYFSFTTFSGNPPGSFTLTSPYNGSVSAGDCTTFSWTTPTGGGGYVITVADNPDYTNPIVNSYNYDLTSKQVYGLEYNKTYYWKVVATNMYGSANATNNGCTFIKKSVLYLDQNWDGLSGWTTTGSGTIEVNPAGQLHMGDVTGTTSTITKDNLFIPLQYTYEFRGKVDDFAPLGPSSNYSSMSTEIYDGTYRLSLAIESDGIYVMQGTSWVKVKSMTMDNDWHVWRVTMLNGNASIYMDGILQATSSTRALSSSTQKIVHFIQGSSANSAESHIDYTRLIYDTVVNEEWTGFTGWTKEGSGTIEISPSGQLHMRDSTGTTSTLTKVGLSIPSQYTYEFRGKIDSFAPLGLYSTMSTEIYDGTYRLSVAIESDGIYIMTDSGWVRVKQMTMDTGWHTWKVVVDNGNAVIYMDDVQQATSSIKTLSSSTDKIVHFIQGSSGAIAESHIDYTKLNTGNVLDEDWGGFTNAGWVTSGIGTMEINNPAGQLHMRDATGTTSTVIKDNLDIPLQYTYVFRGKVDDFAPLGPSSNYSSMSTEIYDGTYRLSLAIESDGIYVMQGATWVRVKQMTMDTNWHIWMVAVDNGSATIYGWSAAGHVNHEGFIQLYRQNCSFYTGFRIKYCRVTY